MKFERNKNWRLVKSGEELFLINIVNSKQLKLESSIVHTIYLFDLIKNVFNKEQIIKNFHKRYPHFEEQWCNEYLKLLCKWKIIEPTTRPPKELTEKYLDGLDRQIDFLAELGSNKKDKFANQLILKHSRIAVLGLGSVAHYTLFSLLSSGIGSFVCVDFDIVEKRNIGRQPIFRSNDIGKTKSEVVKNYITNSRPGTKVIAINKKLKTVKEIKEIIKGCDVVIHSCDLPRFAIHRMINEACLSLNIPNIVCYSGRVGPFCVPHKTACYGCLETFMKKSYVMYDDLANLITDEKEITRFPELAVVGGLSGVLVAKEIVSHLLNLKPQTYNAFFDIDPYKLKILLKSLPKQDSCYICNK